MKELETLLCEHNAWHMEPKDKAIEAVMEIVKEWIDKLSGEAST